MTPQDFPIAPAPAPAAGGLDQLNIAPMGADVPGGGVAAAPPPELLGVLRGDPSAVQVPTPEAAPDNPIVQYAATHFEDILAVGIDFYDALDGSTVFFNPEKLSEPELAELDKAGQINTVAVPVGMGGAAPPADPAPSAPAAPTPAARGGKVPADTSNRLAGARLNNMAATNPAPTNPLHGLGARAL